MKQSETWDPIPMNRDLPVKAPLVPWGFREPSGEGCPQGWRPDPIPQWPGHEVGGSLEDLCQGLLGWKVAKHLHLHCSLLCNPNESW